MNEASAARLAAFFWGKGLAAIKEEDAAEKWHQDWIDYQGKHELYASLLSPKDLSSLGHQFDLLKLTRFIEVIAYFSPSHGYSLQVSFLGLFSILMGSNDDLKREAVAALEAGGVFALGISEKDHGSDLLANEFCVTEIAQEAQTPGQFVASGRKYYIGNANCAAMVSILARKHRLSDTVSAARMRRAPLALVAVRPAKSPGYRNVKKIRTLGVRSAFVGAFEAANHELPPGDFIAEGRGAWDAVFGTVTLGKFFLGFGSIGICEHAMEEAIGHLRGRILYRKSVLEMPHIQYAMAQAYARLAAMKLYAYRALDYVHAATATDRRYLLFCAVQKAKVSTEGVKVMSLASECIGARGFEAETYFESALRDAQLIPGLEGSTHINIGLTAQFIDRYVERRRSPKEQGTGQSGAATPAEPPNVRSLLRGDVSAGENPYLMQARAGRFGDIAFAHFLDAYRPLKGISNILRFARQASAFARLVRARKSSANAAADAVRQTADSSTDGAGNGADLRIGLCLGQCMATIAYAQLIAENAILFEAPAPIVSAIFHLLILDLSAAAMALAALPALDSRTRRLARRMIAIPRTSTTDWDAVAARMNAMEGV